MGRKLKILTPSELSETIAIVVGTRPGIIKMSPLIRECEAKGIDHLVIHTGQHYSYEMDQVFFEDLELPTPKFHLRDVARSHYHGEQTAAMIRGVEKALLDAKPRVVLVCGDANTNLAAGLAARKLRLVVGHVEAGLRSWDWTMPEEHNRIMLDHTCELLFAPTESAKRNLEREVVRGRIIVTGNTIVDAVYQNLELARSKSRAAEEFELEPGRFGLCTVHREENVDHEMRLRQILEGLVLVAEKFSLPIVFPVHPRTRLRLERFGLKDVLEGSRVRLIEPLRYLDFLLLLASTRLCLTDSGGIQEEGCILKVPCVTLRQNTERPETIAVGANVLAGTTPQTVLESSRQMIERERTWPNPFGDGRAAQRIIEATREAFHEDVSPRSHPRNLAE